MAEKATVTDEELKGVLVNCARAISEERSLGEALGISADYLERVEQRAHELYVAERYDTVETLMRGVIAIDPDRFYARLLLGDSLTRQANFEEGLEHIERAHELVPDSEHIRFTLGQAYARGGSIDLAKKTLSGFTEESDFHQLASAILERIDQVEAAHT